MFQSAFKEIKYVCNFDFKELKLVCFSQSNWGKKQKHSIRIGKIHLLKLSSPRLFNSIYTRIGYRIFEFSFNVKSNMKNSNFNSKAKMWL